MSGVGQAVFLSYAAPDEAATQRLASALRAASIEVWFHLDEIRTGNDWDRTVRKQIRECALFVPVVSAQTQAQHEGIFRLEWHLAEQRSQLIAKGRAFIAPVCIDDTTEQDALVPEAFFALPWARTAGDERLAQFVSQVQRLLAQPLHGSRSNSAGAAARKIFTPESPSIPDYELIRQIGRGSYGDVWLARSVTGIYRAVKLVWRERFTDPAPFEREFKGLAEFAAVSLGESIQLALLHVGRNDDVGFFYYVMELADDAERGRSIDPERYVPLTLAELHKRRGRVSARDCLGYGVELARVLAGLHARGLVHRDIKPSNVILVNGVPKLADIGLVAPSASARTFVGTEGYVPPEGPGSPAADVYALGKVLYELSTGLDRQEFPQLPSGLTGLSDHHGLLELNEIVLRACDPSPSQRYRDGAALLADLEVLRAGRPVLRPSRWPVAVAAGLVLALGLAGFFAWSKKDAPPPTAPVSRAGAPPKAPAAASTQPADLPVRPAPGPFHLPVPAGEKSLVVLPLKNLSLALKDSALGDDLQQELIATLARLPDVGVLARGSTLRLKSAKLAPAQFAAKMGKAHLLQGSVRRIGDKMNLDLELCRAGDDAVVWTKHYETELRDCAAMLTDFAGDIARALHARDLEGTFAGTTERYYTRNPAAFDLFMKARRASADQRDVAASEAAITLAEEVMKLDPNFGAAALLLAASHLNAYRSERDQGAKPRYAPGARHWAETASRLLLGSGDRELANYYLLIEPDYPRAVAFAENTARTWPHDARINDELALAYFRAGRMAEAVAAYRHALSLDPLDARSRELELVYIARLRRVDTWDHALAEYRAIIGAEPSGEALAIQRYALTGELPAEIRSMGYVSRMDWLWRARKFGDVAALAEIELPKPKSGMVELFTLQTRWCEALQRAGRGDEAVSHATEAMKLAVDIATRALLDPSTIDLRLGRALALLGSGDQAVAAMRRGVEAVSPATQQTDRWDREIRQAELLASLGRGPECVALLAGLLRAPSGLTVPMLRVAPEWDLVRDDAGFQALLADPKNNAPL